jgi:hypothetical protein
MRQVGSALIDEVMETVEARFRFLDSCSLADDHFRSYRLHWIGQPVCQQNRPSTPPNRHYLAEYLFPRIQYSEVPSDRESKTTLGFGIPRDFWDFEHRPTLTRCRTPATKCRRATSKDDQLLDLVSVTETGLLDEAPGEYSSLS